MNQSRQPPAQGKPLISDTAAEPARQMQERGRLRHAALVRAGRELLQSRPLDQIALPDIAIAADIPKSSAYHFFADVMEVHMAIAAQVSADLMAHMQETDLPDEGDWTLIVTQYMRQSVAFFNADYAATQLLLGPKAPAEIKLRDRESDFAIGVLLHERLAARFLLPQQSNWTEIFFRAIEIADLFFGLSVIRHGRITPEFEAEACAASCAYLALYLPHRMQPASDAGG